MTAISSRWSRRGRIIVGLLVVVALMASACASSDGGSDDAGAPATTDGSGDGTATDDGAAIGDGAADPDGGGDVEGIEAGADPVLDTTGGAAAVPGMPDTAAGRLAGAILSGAAEDTLTVEEVAGALSPAFQPTVAPATLRSQLSQLPGLLGRSPVVVEVRVDTEYAVGGTLLNPTDDSEWPFAVGVEVNEPHRLLSLVVVPQTPPAELDLDRAGVEAAWADLASMTDLAVVELGTGAAVGADDAAACPTGGEQLAIGSAFKLYVLGAVATAVDAGALGWDDPVTIDEAVYSLPSGQLQQEAPGTQLTVAQTAELMLGISDNTATDHLMALVGREAVEAEQAAMGHTDPARNQPFFTTRELFQLKLGDPIRLGLVAEADEDERRGFLDDLAAEPLPEFEPGDFTTPTAIDVEWLASVGDLCRAMVDLDQRSRAGHPEVGEAITASTGVPIERQAWAEVAFKAGSEPGVLNATWLLTHVDGRRFVLSATANDPDQILDEVGAFALLDHLIDLLADG